MLWRTNCGRRGKRRPPFRRVFRPSHSYYCYFNELLPTDSAGEAKLAMNTFMRGRTFSHEALRLPNASR